MSSTREALLARRTRRAVTLGGEPVAHVRAMSLNELAAFEQFIEALKDDPEKELKATLALVVRTCCDERGVMTFAAGDENQLREMDPAVIRAIGEAAAELNLGAGEKKASPPPGGSS